VATEHPPPTDPDREAFWRDFLTNGDPRERRARNLFRHLPHSPRCQLCAAPFAGAFVPVMRLVGREQSTVTPNWCGSCTTFITQNHGGAEIVLTLLLADIRGSTTMAERSGPSAFQALLNRFYATASQVVFDHDGYVDKFVGDELISMFFPLLTGERHAARAVEAAQALLAATGHGSAEGPWVPLGAAVHTGSVWFGAIGEGRHVELTAVGDAMNATARLASLAKAGEILVTAEAAHAAALDPTLPTEALELRGKEQTTEIVRLQVGSG
jgi:adenylate cyclase